MPERTFLIQQLSKWPGNTDCDFTDTSIEDLQSLLADCIDDARKHVMELHAMRERLHQLITC